MSISKEQKIDYVPIKVTSGILMHIGAGIYKSAAGAIKELVSNSFDADAPQVTINTDYPKFEEIVVADNGNGMSANRFKQAMQTIGSSLKGSIDPVRETSKYKRPIIGQLGIGLMALSQVCNKAIIESQEPNTNTKFIAELDFSIFKSREVEQMEYAKLEVLMEMYGGLDNMKEIMENPETLSDELAEVEELYNLALEAKEKLQQIIKDNPDADLEGEHLGYCIIYSELPATLGENGTTIRLQMIDEEVKNGLRDITRSESYLPKKHKQNGWNAYRNEINSLTWAEICEKLQLGTSGFSFEALPEYHQFVWELSLITPIAYFDRSPLSVPTPLGQDKKQDLDEFNFNLMVDHFILKKPIFLPSGNLTKEISLEKGVDYSLLPVVRDDVVDGQRLAYSGYIYWQKEQNKPSPIQGLQIYIRNVGIGLYDKSLLNYDKVNPSSRIGQISGEIYVEEGLERALSVDRSSFRETDAHYMSIRDHIWRMLGTYKSGDGLFGTSVEAYRKRKDKKDDAQRSIHQTELKTIVNDVSDGKLQVEFSNEDGSILYEVKNNKEVIVNESSPIWPRAVKDRRLIQKILVAVKSAIETNKSPHEILEILERILLNK